ncbi:hypothetical protein KKC45_03920 [Patescibacteria group bacterium]|nr:hypothetical protein [Patescibacteria group bacterium]
MKKLLSLVVSLVITVLLWGGNCYGEKLERKAPNFKPVETSTVELANLGKDSEDQEIKDLLEKLFEKMGLEVVMASSATRKAPKYPVITISVKLKGKGERQEVDAFGVSLDVKRKNCYGVIIDYENGTVSREEAVRDLENVLKDIIVVMR